MRSGGGLALQLRNHLFGLIDIRLKNIIQFILVWLSDVETGCFVLTYSYFNHFFVCCRIAEQGDLLWGFALGGLLQILGALVLRCCLGLGSLLLPLPFFCLLLLQLQVLELGLFDSIRYVLFY